MGKNEMLSVGLQHFQQKLGNRFLGFFLFFPRNILSLMLVLIAQNSKVINSYGFEYQGKKKEVIISKFKKTTWKLCLLLLWFNLQI